MIKHPSGDTPIPEGATTAERTIERWKGKTVLVPSVVIAVAATPTRLAKLNPRRLWIVVYNADVGDIFVDFGAYVTNPQGFQLTPRGGLLELVLDEDGELCTSEIWALAPNGPLNAIVWEQQTL